MAKTTSTATYDDVNLLLRLYEMRREERLRKARAWFTAKFHPATWAEAMELCPPGSDENTSMRMAASYWDMTASFINAGVLQADLFFESGRELLIVWMRMEPVLADLRKMFGDPFAFHNLEKAGKDYAEWMNHRAPGSYEAFAERMRGIR